MSTKLISSQQRIHAWLLPVASGAATLQHFNLLSEAEQSAAQRILSAEEKNIFVISKAFLRVLLQSYTDIPANEWGFETNAFGRPFVKYPAQYRNLYFSVSHTKGLTACVLAETSEIGIDIENITQDRRFIDIARGFFSSKEFDVLAATPRQELNRKFYAYWTLKEAYVKAMGVGLSLSLSSFWFDLKPRPHIFFCAESKQKSDEWRFLSHSLTDQIHLSLAIRTLTMADVDLCLSWVEPDFLAGLQLVTRSDIAMLAQGIHANSIKT
jgi:4'-phosphopantetheinyl transferase